MSTPSSYKKAVATAFGRDYKTLIEIACESLTNPGPGEALVKNEIAGINASDINMLAGKYFADASFPFDLGFEFGGKVVAVGAGVTNLKPGDAVIGIKTGAGYREYVTMPATELIPVPAISAQIISLLTVGLAASIGLTEVGEMKSGETVLVTAAAGGTGNIAVQLAKLAGNHVIGTCSSDEKADSLKALGCDRVINYRKEKLEEVLATEYPEGVNLVFDNVGGTQFDACLAHLARKARLVVCGFISEYTRDEPEQIHSARVYHQLLWKSASIRAFLFSDYPEQIPAHLQKLMELQATGKLKVGVDSTTFQGLDSLIAAMDHMYQGKNNGRVVLRF